MDWEVYRSDFLEKKENMRYDLLVLCLSGLSFLMDRSVA